jgi:hypothetical protein
MLGNITPCILRPALSETETFELGIPIGVAVVDCGDFLVVPFNEHHSANSDSAVRLTADCDLTTITIILLVGVYPLLEAIPGNEFTFVINETTFPASIVKAAVLSPAVREQLQIDDYSRRFVIWDREID